ncbi:MAG: hypothetical protein MHM6MM_008292 [Cercozoa sp. M6MM]
MGGLLLSGTLLLTLSVPVAILATWCHRAQYFLVASGALLAYLLSGALVMALAALLSPSFNSVLVAGVGALIMESTRLLVFQQLTMFMLKFRAARHFKALFPMHHLPALLVCGAAWGLGYVVLLQLRTLAYGTGGGTVYHEKCGQLSAPVVSSIASLGIVTWHVAAMPLYFALYTRRRPRPRRRYSGWFIVFWAANILFSTAHLYFRGRCLQWPLTCLLMAALYIFLAAKYCHSSEFLQPVEQMCHAAWWYTPLDEEQDDDDDAAEAAQAAPNDAQPAAIN